MMLSCGYFSRQFIKIIIESNQHNQRNQKNITATAQTDFNFIEKIIQQYLTRIESKSNLLKQKKNAEILSFFFQIFIYLFSPWDINSAKLRERKRELG